MPEPRPDTGWEGPRLVEAAPILAAEGLRFEAGGARLIDDMSLEIAAGRVTVIMGANGSGKSLLLRLLHGLIRPSDGCVLWRGAPLDRAGRRAQAMVFQRPVLLRRSVRSNLRFALRVAGFRGNAAAVREEQALERARLTELAGRPARLLSGGRAAAAGHCPGAGTGAGDPVSRRADREPRPGGPPTPSSAWWRRRRAGA